MTEMLSAMVVGFGGITLFFVYVITLAVTGVTGALVEVDRRTWISED